MVQRGQYSGSLFAGPDIAGMLVLDTDDQVVLRGMVGESAEGADNAVETLFGADRPPIREDADDAGAGAFGDFEGAGFQARLIFKRMLGGEHVLLEPRIHFGSVGEDAL